MGKIVEVAAAVIMRPDGTFLLGRRPAGSVYAGYWEFPGGKIEAGETPREALIRELREELGIEAERLYPWLKREFIYAHAHVCLHFFRVTAWRGEIRDLQHDALSWCAGARQGGPQGARVPGGAAHCGAVQASTSVSPMLPANAPILAALSLPDFYAITQAAKIGIEAQLRSLRQALENGLRLVQLREPELPAEERLSFYRAATAACHAFGARVLCNADEQIALAIGADGVHFKAAQLRRLASRPALPLVAASCHSREDLAQAAKLDLDFVVLGPVRETATHPGVTGMGWQRFSELATDSPLPIFALGGLGHGDLEAAWAASAHGIAAIRAAWVA